MAFVRIVTSGEDFRVELVDHHQDLSVYISKNKSQARGKDEIWFFEDSTGSDKIKIKFVTSGEDIKVKYVNSASMAGWKNKTHKLQKRIG